VNRGDFLLGVGAVVGGALLTIVVEVLRGQVERRQRRADRRADFQRQTLLDLQDALLRSIIDLMDLRDEHRRMAAGGGPDGLSGPDLPDPDRDMEETAARMEETAARIVLLAARVDDDEVRRLVSEYRVTVRSISEGEKSDEEAYAVVERALTLQREVNERIGSVLRQT
jgi:hypothetical protein